MTYEEKIAMMQAHADSILETPPGPIRERPHDKTSMSYWFPLIEAAGLPVPETKFVEMTDTCRRMIWDIFDGKDSGSVTEPFFVQLTEAADGIGYPCFLRTDHTSGKHSWSTCFLQSAAAITAHVLAIAEFSECAGMIGIPWNIWAVREFLPIIPYGTCPSYGGMPVNRKFRFFVDDGKVRCYHPYWPLESLEQGGWKVDADETTAYMELCNLDDRELELLHSLACRAGQACGGSWSIDFLETEKGWYLADMAEAHKSFHWEGCGHAHKR